ncbi:hypothetical protein HDU96_009123 [Phlyctochytrium bullatum]|nr:hypothetical protein HDU96_009123 [Phlyctochytrium bullatum]
MVYARSLHPTPDSKKTTKPLSAKQQPPTAREGVPKGKRNDVDEFLGDDHNWASKSGRPPSKPGVARQGDLEDSRRSALSTKSGGRGWEAGVKNAPLVHQDPNKKEGRGPSNDATVPSSAGNQDFIDGLLDSTGPDGVQVPMTTVVKVKKKKKADIEVEKIWRAAKDKDNSALDAFFDGENPDGPAKIVNIDETQKYDFIKKQEEQRPVEVKHEVDQFLDDIDSISVSTVASRAAAVGGTQPIFGPPKPYASAVTGPAVGIGKLDSAINTKAGSLFGAMPAKGPASGPSLATRTPAANTVGPSVTTEAEDLEWLDEMLGK